MSITEICGMTYGPALHGHEGTMCNYSMNHWGKCGRTEDGPEPTKPKRPVKLQLTEAEAALVLNMVRNDSCEKSYDADRRYRDGTGFEAKCAQLRAEASEAAKVAIRVRKALAKSLAETYGDNDDE